MSDDPVTRAAARIGAVLNEKWTLVRLIGLGGMAAVYAGRHRNGARGAVKLLHPELSRSPEVRERFLREGYAANRVEHSGAVRVLDDDVVNSGPDAGTAYLIMELLDGESLEDRMRRRPGPFAEAEALAVAEGLLDVLVAAHANGVIHRDIKPENIFLATGENPEDNGEFGFERVKLLDFGLARIAHGDLVTQSGMALGTPSFMAPEQAEGRAEDIDGRTDLFAVGANLYRMLTAQKIHEAPNVLELVMKMAKVPAPAVRDARHDLSGATSTIVDRALRFRREDRYPDASTMRADVRAAREGRPLPSELGTAVTMMNIPGLTRSADDTGPSREPSSPSASAPLVHANLVRPARSGALLLLVAVLFVGVGALAASRWLRPAHPSDPTAEASSPSPADTPANASSSGSSASLPAEPSSSGDPSAAATGEMIELGDAEVESTDAEVDASTDANVDALTPPIAKVAPKPKYTKPAGHPKKKKK